jgi:hypothetical protein
MLTALVAASLVVAVVGLVLFAGLCVAIQREDHSPRLPSRPPTAGAAFTRRVSGLSVRRAAPPVPRRQSEARAALWPARPPDAPHLGP